VQVFAPAEVTTGFSDELHEALSRLEAGSFWFRARNALIAAMLERYFPNARSFFEIGCGTGFVLSGLRARFPFLELSGSDLSPHGLVHARRRVPGAHLFQADARRLPFVDHFDVVGAFDVLEHVAEDEVVLEQMRKAARRDGAGVLLTVPQHRWLWSTSDEAAGHVRRYSLDELRQKVMRAGLELIRVTSFVSLLFPAMAASRLRPFRGSGLSSYEVALSPLLDRALGSAMTAERSLIRAGLSFPVGGSLFVAARVLPASRTVSGGGSVRGGARGAIMTG
jgi:SAM-dependent methyltransferase